MFDLTCFPIMFEKQGKMGEPMMLLTEIKKETADWTAKITVTEDLPMLVGFQRGTKYKRYIFTDDAGNTVPAVVFGNEIPIFEKTLHLHGVYKISNARVRQPTETQRMHGYDLDWVLQRSTLVRPMRSEQPNLSHFLEGMTPIEMITDAMADQETIINVMGIVIKAEPSKSVPTKFGEGNVQRFTLVDTARRPIPLSIWGQLIEQVGEALTEAASNHSVVVVKRVLVKSYRVPQLASTNSTSFTIDPPIERVLELKSWFGSVAEMEMPSLLADYSISYYKNLVDQNIVKKYSVGEIKSTNKCGDFWARAFLQLTEGTQRLHYIGCSNCYTRVSSRPNVQYDCLLCNKTVTASIRPRVSMDIYDHSGRITAGAIEIVAESILQCNKTQLTRFIAEGIGYNLEPIKTEFQDKMYLVLLRRSHSKRSESHTRILLVAYFDDTCPPESSSTNAGISRVESLPRETAAITSVQASQAGPVSNISKEPTESPLKLSPLKRQMENIDIQSASILKKALFEDSGSGKTNPSYGSAGTSGSDEDL